MVPEFRIGRRRDTTQKVIQIFVLLQGWSFWHTGWWCFWKKEPWLQGLTLHGFGCGTDWVVALSGSTESTTYYGKLDHYRPGVGKVQITNMVHAGRRRKRNTGWDKIVFNPFYSLKLHYSLFCLIQIAGPTKTYKKKILGCGRTAPATANGAC